MHGVGVLYCSVDFRLKWEEFAELTGLGLFKFLSALLPRACCGTIKSDVCGASHQPTALVLHRRHAFAACYLVLKWKQQFHYWRSSRGACCSRYSIKAGHLPQQVTMEVSPGEGLQLSPLIGRLHRRETRRPGDNRLRYVIAAASLSVWQNDSALSSPSTAARRLLISRQGTGG
jgi:hypothetical protein